MITAIFLIVLFNTPQGNYTSITRYDSKAECHAVGRAIQERMDFASFVCLEEIASGNRRPAA